ncbi:MAG: hypothetical protein AAF927_08670 [Bacteroidota bacterium]
MPNIQDMPPAPSADQFKDYDGDYEFTYMQLEYATRALDFKCKVQVANGNIRVIQAKNHLTGGPLIMEGYLFLHKSGNLIIVEREEQREAEEVGGCSEAVVINWENKEIESC